MNKALRLIVLMILPLSSAHAWLGGTADSIDKDRVAMSAKIKQQKTALYTVSEMHTGAVVIRQYASNTGQIFAVTWRGMRPDLETVLGPFYSEYRAALAHRPKVKGRIPLSIATPTFTLSQSGQARGLRGHAAAIGLVPAGVEVEELP